MQKNPISPNEESIVVDIENTAISSQDAGWYYSTIDITNRIPDGYKAIGIESFLGWQGNVFFNLHENNSPSMRCCRRSTPCGAVSTHRI